MDVAAILRTLMEALAKLLPSVAAYLAGKSSAEAAARQKTLADIERAKDVADSISDADVKRLRGKWTR